MAVCDIINLLGRLMPPHRVVGQFLNWIRLAGFPSLVSISTGYILSLSGELNNFTVLLLTFSHDYVIFLLIAYVIDCKSDGF